MYKQRETVKYNFYTVMAKGFPKILLRMKIFRKPPLEKFWNTPLIPREVSAWKLELILIKFLI